MGRVERPTRLRPQRRQPTRGDPAHYLTQFVPLFPRSVTDGLANRSKGLAAPARADMHRFGNRTCRQKRAGVGGVPRLSNRVGGQDELSASVAPSGRREPSYSREHGAVEIRTGRLGADQIGAGQIGAGQIGAREIRIAQIGS